MGTELWGKRFDGGRNRQIIPELEGAANEAEIDADYRCGRPAQSLSD